MNQPSLFDSPAEHAKTASPNIPAIHKHLLAVMRTLRNAEIMPWHKAEAAGWEKNFPVLARLLPAEEGEPMLAEFEQEMARLKGA